MRFGGPLKSGIVALLLAGFSMLQGAVFAAAWQPQKLLEFTVASCRAWETETAPAAGYTTAPINKSSIDFRGRQIGSRYRLQVDQNALVELDVIDRTGRGTRFVGSLFDEYGDPLVLLSLSSDCSLQVARKVNYTDHGQAISISSLDANLVPQGKPDWLNPPLEFLARDLVNPLKHPGDATPLRVGMVDSGVNYRIPGINRRLARNTRGELIGYDFWDMDNLPYDAHPVNSGFFLQRHGTRTASLLLDEAPDIELVPYRYPRPDMSRMQALVEHAELNQVSILGLPLGSNRPQDWSIFGQAARAHPHLLFIVSAGNDGRDIDEHPVYPAALDLDNVLVVTSADDFVRPAERTNWGRISVDYLVPAERLNVLDYSGNKTRVSGSSYAVSRLVAIAARLKQAHRHWDAADIIAELRKRFGAKTAAALDWVSSGYIADPLAYPFARKAFTKTPLPDLNVKPSQTRAGFWLSLDVLVLDPRWSRQRVERAVQQAYDILAQCGVVARDISVHAIGGDDYLRDLATGSARTLLEAADTEHTTVVFARDTRMQAEFLGEAFGLGNTRRRPWLVNSVWLMLDVDDPGIALAHELYHVLANSGVHVSGAPNLMQDRTRPESLELTGRQCQKAQVVGVANGLLQE